MYLSQLVSIVTSMHGMAYPLLGPRFMGCLLNAHRALVRLQLAQGSDAVSFGASHLICRTHQCCVVLARQSTNLFSPALVARTRNLLPLVLAPICSIRVLLIRTSLMSIEAKDIRAQLCLLFSVLLLVLGWGQL